MYLFHKLGCREVHSSSSERDSLRASILHELSGLFSRGHFFLCDDDLRNSVTELPYGPRPFPVDIKIGQFISPQMKSNLEAFVQRVVEENEPRLIKPRVEVMNSKTSGGSLQVVVAGFIEGESDPLQLITSVYG